MNFAIELTMKKRMINFELVAKMIENLGTSKKLNIKGAEIDFRVLEGKMKRLLI